MSGTFQGQSLGPWVLCDPPSPKGTDLQGIVISPVKFLSDQDKPVHAALVLSLSRYCGHVNGHFHHNWPRFWQYCSAWPSFLYSSVPSPPSPSPSINDFFLLLCLLVFLAVCSLCLFLSLRQQQRPTDMADAELNSSLWEDSVMEPLIIWTDTVENCNGWCNTYAGIYCSPQGGKTLSVCVWCERHLTTHTVSGQMGVIILFY